MATRAILSNFFEEQLTQNHPQYLSRLLRALFPTTFLEIAVYLYASDTFRPILALFTHFALHQFFHMYITTRNIFLIPDNAVDWRKLGI